MITIMILLTAALILIGLVAILTGILSALPGWIMLLGFILIDYLIIKFLIERRK